MRKPDKASRAITAAALRRDLACTREARDRATAESNRLSRQMAEQAAACAAQIESLKAAHAAAYRDVNAALSQNISRLQASEDRFKSLVSTIPDIVYRIDAHGVFVFLNEAVELLGYRQEELIGRHFSDILLPDDFERVGRGPMLARPSPAAGADIPKLFDERRTGARRTRGLEVKLVAKNVGHPGHEAVQRTREETVFVEVNSSGIYESDPQTHTPVFRGTVGVIRDISGRKKIESDLVERTHAEQRLTASMAQLQASQAQLIMAEKMGTLGILSAGIAHELNNPLMGMLNFIEYCIRHTDPADRRYPVLLDAVQEVRRCIDIVRDLLTFCRLGSQATETRQALALGDLIRRGLDILNHRIAAAGVSVALQGDLSLRAPVVVSSIQQVFLNLLGNALDALAGTAAGKITIDIGRRGDWARVTITDNGPGIPSAHVARIFDPFYTTKPAGKGTGLGLYFSRCIVNEHGGRLICRNPEGSGTTFELKLPMSATKKDAPV